MRRKLATLALLVTGLAGLAGLALFAWPGIGIQWVGQADVEVSFVVTDAITHEPIENAIVRLHAQPEGSCEDVDESDWILATDKSGHAEDVARRCMCFGTRGAFQNSFASHLPAWSYCVTAPGYLRSDVRQVRTAENSRRVARGKVTSTVLLAVRLRRQP